MLQSFKQFRLFLLSIPVYISAAEQQIPPLQEWSALCQKQTPFCDMPGLPSFILQKNPKPFEDNCRNNRIVNATLVKTVMNTFKICLEASNLNNKKYWADLNNQPFHSVNELSELSAYTIGCNTKSGTRLFIWGDRHGDTRSLPLGLEELQQRKIMSKKDGWKVKHGNCLILLGDYCNNGPYSLEAILTAMMLKIKNANNERVFLLRGNHENLNHPATNDWTIKQATLSLEEDLGQEEAQKTAIEMVKTFQEKLAVALFIGTRNTQTHQGQYLFITHAAPDLGYHPAPLFEALETAPDDQPVYHGINHLTYQRPHPYNNKAKVVIAQHLQSNAIPHIDQYFTIKRDSFPFDLGFLKDWTLNNDGQEIIFPLPIESLLNLQLPSLKFPAIQLLPLLEIMNKDRYINCTLPFSYYHKAGMTLAWGKPLIQALLQDWSNNKSTVIAMIRGHQHTHEGDKRRDPELVYRMHKLWKQHGMIYEWQDQSGPIDGPHLLHKGETYTLNVAPDSRYGCPESTVTGKPHDETMYPGFNYDTIGKFVLSHDPNFWTTEVINIKSFKQNRHPFMYNNHLVTPQI